LFYIRKFLPGSHFGVYKLKIEKALLPGGGVYPHVVQPVLDSKIRKEKWEKETNFFQLRNEYGVELSVTIKQINKLNAN
jgi:hypothetical protein